MEEGEIEVLRRWRQEKNTFCPCLGPLWSGTVCVLDHTAGEQHACTLLGALPIELG